MAVGKIGVNTPDPPIAPGWISATPPKAQVVVPVPHRVIALPPVTRDTDPEPAELFAHVFPMDQRPQAHDIIRTWLFATVVRAHYEGR